MKTGDTMMPIARKGKHAAYRQGLTEAEERGAE